ncbi:hypothetical protein Bealeia1_00899 [Candidatus Bealeia paramacronuclearis]|uniref:Uncharacterized protein n=1 Tax=Candidatus Bealeia paramacronuclearis TaxID=1921001 RepID=A0ABZ2C2W0_9PROT|nr:hypothetical protein [Candidatus Bealeia paramacronuclearis]
MTLTINLKEPPAAAGSFIIKNEKINTEMDKGKRMILKTSDFYSFGPRVYHDFFQKQRLKMKSLLKSPYKQQAPSPELCCGLPKDRDSFFPK